VKDEMTFPKVLEAAKRRRTGSLALWGNILRFARIFTQLTCNLQQESFAGQ